LTISNSNNYSLDGGLYTNKDLSLTIEDDIIEVNQEEAITTINVLSNDQVRQNVKIKLVRFTNGDIVNYEDSVVSGASIETTDEIIVPGEGKWVVKNNKILFIPEQGFDGTPTPIHYIVQDENGNYSNIAKLYKRESVYVNLMIVVLVNLFQ